MLVLTYFFIVASNFIYSIKKKESKLIILLSLVVIVVLMSGAGPNYSFWADYNNYELYYNNNASISIFSTLEFGYNILLRVGHLLGLNFYWFRLIIIMICLIFVYFDIIKKQNVNPHYIITLYMSYQMIIDSEHFKNFIALSILICSIKYLLNVSLKNNIIFLLMVFLAASIHSAFIFYALFIFANLKNKKIIIYSIITLAIMLTIIVILNNNQLPFIGIILEEFGEERLQLYLSYSTNLGYVILFVLQIFNIFTIYISNKFILKREDEIRKKADLKNVDEYLGEDKYVQLIFWINIICIVLFPLFIIEINFYRMIRNLLVLNYIVFAITNKRLIKNSTTIIFFNSIVFLNLIIWFYFDLVYLIQPDRVLIPFFNENIF